MEIFSALLALCAGNSPVTGEFPAHKGQLRGALMFSLICALNKWLSKQLWGWWFETPSRSLWRQCNVYRTFMHLRCTVVGWFPTQNITISYLSLRVYIIKAATAAGGQPDIFYIIHRVLSGAGLQLIAIQSDTLIFTIIPSFVSLIALPMELVLNRHGRTRNNLHMKTSWTIIFHIVVSAVPSDDLKLLDARAYITIELRA